MANTAPKFQEARAVLVAVRDPVIERAVQAALAGTAHVVHVVEEGRATEAAARVVTADVIVVDHARIGVDAELLQGLTRSGRVVLISDKDLPLAVALMATHEGLDHVLARNERQLEAQLAATLRQLLDREIWGARNYLDPDSPVERHVLSASGDKHALVERVAAVAAAAGAFSELPGMAATVASELIMNAVFNAPIDPERGTPKYKETPRHESLLLAPGEEVTLTLGCDGKVLVLGVQDNFGSLTRATLLANLCRSATAGRAQIRMKTEGAGVGLFMTLSAASHLTVRVKPGKVTEIVAVLALSKRARDFERLGHSLNLFFDPKGGGPP